MVAIDVYTAGHLSSIARMPVLNTRTIRAGPCYMIYLVDDMQIHKEKRYCFFNDKE
jgi:hypothetical protein